MDRLADIVTGVCLIVVVYYGVEFVHSTFTADLRAPVLLYEANKLNGLYRRTLGRRRRDPSALPGGLMQPVDAPQPPAVLRVADPNAADDDDRWSSLDHVVPKDLSRFAASFRGTGAAGVSGCAHRAQTRRALGGRSVNRRVWFRRGSYLFSGRPKS